MNLVEEKSVAAQSQLQIPGDGPTPMSAYEYYLEEEDDRSSQRKRASSHS